MQNIKAAKNTKPVYKRKLLIRSDEDAQVMVRGLYSPSLSEWADILEDLITESRSRKSNKLAMFKLQMRILIDIVDSYDVVATYKKLIDDPREAANLIPNEDQLDSYDLNFWKEELTANRILISALKDVGDGIAWRALNYYRPLLYAMSRNEGQGPVRFDKGLSIEMNALGDIVNDTNVGRFVFHAITNIARVGDITAVAKNGDVEFIEVKGKENPRGTQWKNRVNRQVFRLDNLTKIANEGCGIVDGTGLTVKMIEGSPTLLLKQLRQLIQQAKNSGFASIVPYPYLAICAIDFGKVKGQNLGATERAIHSHIRKDGEKIMRMTSFDFFEFSPHRTPLSVYPFEPDDIAKILLGRIQLSYALNPFRFFKEFEQYGWKVVSSMFSQPNHNPESDPFCTLNSGPWYVGLPITLAARAMFEGMTVRSIVNECEAVKTNDPINLPEASAYGYADEHRLWD